MITIYEVRYDASIDGAGPYEQGPSFAKEEEALAWKEFWLKSRNTYCNFKIKEHKCYESLAEYVCSKSRVKLPGVKG